MYHFQLVAELKASLTQMGYVYGKHIPVTVGKYKYDIYVQKYVFNKSATHKSKVYMDLFM